MLRGNCTEALSIQANVAISCYRAKLIKDGIALLPFPLPALLKQYWYIKRGERVRVRGHPPFYATLGLTLSPREERVGRERERGASTLSSSSPRPLLHPMEEREKPTH